MPASKLTIPRYINAIENVLLVNNGVMMPAMNQAEASVLKRLESCTLPSLESFDFLAMSRYYHK